MRYQLEILSNILKKNIGVITLITLFVFYRIWKTSKKTFHVRYLHFLSYIWPRPYAEFTKFDGKNCENAEYLVVNNPNGTFFIVKSSCIAAKLFKNLEYFEDLSFTSRIYKFCQKLCGVVTTNDQNLNFNILESIIADGNEASRNYGKLFGDGETQRKSNEYETFSSESFAKRNTFSKSELCSSLETRDVEKPRSRISSQFTSETRRNAEEASLLAERFNGEEKRTIKQCYSDVSFTEQPFSLMKNFDDSRIRVMNFKSALITEKSVSNVDENRFSSLSKDIEYVSLLQHSLPLIKFCIKETIVLLEAKSNRNDVINIKEYCYKHAVNVVGICVFGKKITSLTSSKCRFYTVCDHLYRLVVVKNGERNRFQKYVDGVLVRTGFQKKPENPSEIVEYFANLVADCFDDDREHRVHENCIMYGLVKKFKLSDAYADSEKEAIDLITSFLIALSMNILETMAGTMSLILHELSGNFEQQEKVRNNDKVKFDLEGNPCLNFEDITQLANTDSIIKETLRIYPIDSVIQLSCKQSYQIPETKIQINPKSIVLIPLHVLRTDEDLYRSQDSFNPQMYTRNYDEYDFITDPEIRLFSVFVRHFVQSCTKVTLATLIQQYEFNTEMKSEKRVEKIISCRFSTLPSTLLLRTAKVEKREKVVIFAESLKAFHASKLSTFSILGL